jgi:hypothetical protein
MALCGVDGNVLSVLHFTKLHTIWPIYATRDEAIEAVHR